MSRIEPRNRRRGLRAFALVLLLPTCMSSQITNFCKDSEPDQANPVLLEISRTGRGMIWPNVISQVFFRVYKNGSIEYQVPTTQQIRTRKDRLNPAALQEIRAFMEARDFLDAKQEYPLLESLKDARMKTCVKYEQTGQYKHILLINYMPNHPAAQGYYPPSLVKLLQKIENIRPKTDYEHRYGLDKLSFQ